MLPRLRVARLGLISLLGSLIAVPIVAAPAVAGAAAPACAGTAADEATAAAIAKACNRTVEVTSATSETILATAEPSGQIRWQHHLAPARVKRGSSWVPVDTNLRLVNGSPAPVASTVDVRFSKGGTDPLITVTDRAGTVSLSWPTPLPAPILDSDAAIYPEVFSGVDLRVRATSTGFTHVLVVKNAAAAANPALRSVTYRWSGAGLSVRSAADRTVEIVDGLGGVVLESAPASMWDSDTGAAPAGAHQSMTAGGSAQGATVEGAAPSDPDSAGDAATLAPVTAVASASEVTVTPDAAMLASAATLVYPLFIDPPFGLTRQRWAWMSSNLPNSNDSHARAGNNPDGAGIFRSLFQFDISGLAGKTVYDAKFNTVLYHSSSCTDTPVSLWYGNDIAGGVANGARTPWRSDQLITYLEEKWGHANKGGGCADSPQNDQPMEFSDWLATRIQQSVNNSWNFITLTLSTANWNQQGESDTSWWKKFWWNQTSVTVWHNASPNTPAVQPFNGTTDCYKACTPATVSANITHTDGWWKLRETSGSTASDASGNNRNGTATGVTWADNSAVVNGAGLIATTGPVLNTTGSYTVSAWAKLSATDTYMTIAAQAGTANNAFFLQYSKAFNTWAFVSPAQNSATPTGYYSAIATGPPALNTWVHLVGVYDQTGQSMKLYLNNSLAGTTTNPSAWNATGALRIGASGPGWDPLKGAVSNVQAYQRALSSAEITALYTSGRTGGALQPVIVRTTQPTLAVQVSDPDNGTLKTDFEVRTAASDTAALVTSTQISERASGSSVPWPVPSGKLADGSTYFWRARAVDEINWVSPWTAWQVLKVDTSPPPVPSANSAQYPEQMWGAVVNTAGTFTLRSATSEAVDFQWQIDAGNVSSPIPGSGTNPKTASITYTPSTDMNHRLTVYVKDMAGWQRTYNYDFSVTPSIARYSYWNLNETAGTATAADSGNGGTVGGSSLTPLTRSASGVNFGPGKTGNGAVFTADGSLTANSPVLNTTSPAGFTVMAWVNASDLGADRTVMSQDGNASSGMLLHFDKEANAGVGGWCFSMRATDGATPVSACAAGMDPLMPVTNTWVHLAGVYDPANSEIRVYVMGNPNNCFPAEADAKPFSTTFAATGPLVVGRARAASASTEFWRGGIDEVYAYQKVLDGVEICQAAGQ